MIIKNKTKFSKVIAREILIFFGSLLIIVLTFSFLFLRNSYLKSRKTSFSEKISELTLQLDSLPEDYIAEIYAKTNKYFVINYKLNKSIYAITKEKENSFLYDEYGIKKNVEILPTYPDGYSYFKLSDPFGILEKDSVVLFDFISIDKFRDFISQNDYQNKFYSVFSNDPDQDNMVNVNSLLEEPMFNPVQPDNGYLDLGKIEEFKDLIKLSLYNNSQKMNLENEIAILKASVDDYNIKILSSSKIKQIVIYLIIITIALIYVLRFSVLSVLWAFRIIKLKEKE